MTEERERHESEEEPGQKSSEKEILKKRLLQEGLEEKDIDISIDLGQTIAQLNFLVFGKNIPVMLVDFECQQNKDIRALYAPKTKRQKESYVVYIPKMADSLEKAKFYFDENGNLTTEETIKPITTQELLLQIAAHEVRHRLQHNSENLMTKTKNKSEKEHDSHSVEFTAVEAFHQGKTLEEIAELIRENSNKEEEREPEEPKTTNLKRATLEDVDIALAVEKSLKGTMLYSALTDRKELMAEIKNGFFYLLERDGKIVGDVSYEMKDENHAYISGLVVTPEFQGQGIAKQAMKMILEVLKDIKIIDLVTHPDNKKAISLYESLGFKKVGKPQENYYGDGEPRIKMVLEK